MTCVGAETRLNASVCEQDVAKGTCKENILSFAFDVNALKYERRSLSSVRANPNMT
jgi:hypothetical protein